MVKTKRFAALALLGSLVAAFTLVDTVKTPVLPDDCVWIKFPYGYLCIREDAVVATGVLKFSNESLSAGAPLGLSQ